MDISQNRPGDKPDAERGKGITLPEPVTFRFFKNRRKDVIAVTLQTFTPGAVIRSTSLTFACLR